MFFRKKRQSEASEKLQKNGRRSGRVFVDSAYFDEAEPAMDWQLEGIILPFLNRYVDEIDYTTVLDFAAGHGRNTSWLKESAETIVLVDVNRKSLNICKERFGTSKRFKYLQTNGTSLKGIRDKSISFIYSWDSMVHFESDVIFSYISEFKRVLKPGGHAFCHHSNYTANPGGSFLENPDWRNFMSKELFAHYLLKEGLDVVEQEILAWGAISDLDCITLFRRPRIRRLMPLW